jgi:transcriptional regulator with XRE-family HTH domain
MGKSLESLYNQLDRLLTPHGAVSEFCRKTKIGRSTVDAWLRRESSPTVATLEIAAEALKREPWELLRPEGAKPALPPSLEALAAKVDELAKRNKVLEAAHSEIPALTEKLEPELAAAVKMLISAWPKFDEDEKRNIETTCRLATGQLAAASTAKERRRERK